MNKERVEMNKTGALSERGIRDMSINIQRTSIDNNRRMTISDD